MMELKDRIAALELQFELAHRKAYGSGNSTSSTNNSKKQVIPTVSIAANSESELNAVLNTFCNVIGQRGLGNRRHGKNQRVFYAALTRYSLNLIKNNIKLPRYSLSKEQVNDELVDLLKQFKKIDPRISIRMLHTNSQLRNRVHHRLERVFVHVANVIEKKPPQI